jgi:hypothetical protein
VTRATTWLVPFLALGWLIGGCDAGGFAAGEGPSLTTLSAWGEGLVARVEHGQAAVTVRFLRGAERPQAVKEAQPELGAYELDILVQDRRGHVFLVEFGGHGPADPAWLGLIQPPGPDLDLEELREDTALAGEAARLLEQEPKATLGFALAVRSLAALAEDAQREEPGDGANLLQPQAPPAGAGPGQLEPGDRESVGSALEWAHIQYYKHRISIRADWREWPLLLAPITYQHSATQLRVFRCVLVDYCESTAVLVIGTNNHGTAVTHVSMSQEDGCPREFTGSLVYEPLFQPYFFLDGGAAENAGGCYSDYGLSNGDHLCNDDSLVQYWMVKHARTEAFDFDTCHDDTNRLTAPDCTF